MSCRLWQRGNCFLNKQRLILTVIANIFAHGFVVVARFFHVLNLPVMFIAAWRVIGKIKNNFLYLLLRIVLTSLCVETPFLLCYTVIYRNGLS